MIGEVLSGCPLQSRRIFDQTGRVEVCWGYRPIGLAQTIKMFQHTEPFTAIKLSATAQAPGVQGFSL
ncbi:hypothetical protein, partial [uncultured Thiodictyon sp.]|uniref:hypothetical protein n=1 Tax=uncultured Thiodictyon sp. TaxID=1846217 RepID=UPI0025F9C2D2